MIGRPRFFQAVIFEKFDNRGWYMDLAERFDGREGYMLQDLEGKDCGRVISVDRLLEVCDEARRA